MIRVTGMARRLTDRLLMRLFEEGVTIVPGSDATAFGYFGQIEFYERVGIPVPDILRIATLVPAQV